MPYWPQPQVLPHAITTASEFGLGPYIGGTTAAVIGAANRAVAAPIILPVPVRAKRLFTRTGATITANVDLGIYRHDLTLVVSTGSQALAVASGLQFYDIADTDLPAGNYYLAIAASTNTGQIGQLSVNGAMSRFLGCIQMTGGFPLPATWVPFSASFLPFVGMEIGRIV